MGSSLTPELKRLLTQAGCAFERHGKGDHDIWYSPLTARRFTVDHKIVSRHTANGVLRQAGLPKAF
ncbi:type II toxin-antitoxin system HicA family toxin [uncultured Thiodictyon sp.]|uniref:type II toxin-antitoxin system HicA family toxin n=1 Tax=uncultured Thiodictyon sp. TaxID=1846217 RepID=UPI0025FFF55F|nr:type II toxin-antitoxin system HicA family toxin [uncultured Thiodictyon sp.]